MKAVIGIQARINSTRLPGKVLLPINERPMIAHIHDRLSAVGNADAVFALIPNSLCQGRLIDALDTLMIPYLRGSENDVLCRYVEMAYRTHADVVIRATGDNPLVDPVLAEALISLMADNPMIDYASGRDYPVGTTVEAIRTRALLEIDSKAHRADDREHVTLYIKRRPAVYNLAWLDAPADVRAPGLELSVDTEPDYWRIKRLMERLYQRYVNFIPLAEIVKEVSQ